MRRRMAVPILLAVGCALGSCGDDEPATGQGSSEAVLRAPRTSILSIRDDPGRYEGQTIRVDGTVERVLSPYSLVIGTGGVIGERTLLVLTREPAAPLGLPIVVGEHAIAIGVVRRTDVAGYERELGRSLGREVAAAVTGEPVLVARAIGRVGPSSTDWAHAKP